MIVNK